MFTAAFVVLCIFPITASTTVFDAAFISVSMTAFIPTLSSMVKVSDAFQPQFPVSCVEASCWKDETTNMVMTQMGLLSFTSVVFIFDPPTPKKQSHALRSLGDTQERIKDKKTKIRQRLLMTAKRTGVCYSILCYKFCR